jgi:RNase P/RNase MRP subunit POP5
VINCKSIWKKEIVAYSRKYSGYLVARLRKTKRDISTGILHRDRNKVRGFIMALHKINRAKYNVF